LLLIISSASEVFLHSGAVLDRLLLLLLQNLLIYVLPYLCNKLK